MNAKVPMLVMAIIMLAALFFAGQGVVMHSQVSTEEAKFHALQTSYFSQAKSVRDGAATGSALSNDLVEIQKYPSELMRLKLIGVGKILTGIFLILFAILMALMMMPIRLAAEIKK